VSPVKRLFDFGQSAWLDFIERDLLVSGELTRLIDEWGLRGMTSNPAIFEKAIANTRQYDDDIARLARDGLPAQQVYEALAIADVRKAADLFRPIYDATAAFDGYVSLEVSPHLALDAEATIADARRLWSALERPNIMIKVPGTRPGLDAIRQLIGEGINVNVTLLFSVPRYAEVAGAYAAGLAIAQRAGRPLERIASVASFFLSRIDTAVDRQLDARANADPACASDAARLRGSAAIASARLAYSAFEASVTGERWEALAGRGARPQRLLWASTGTKDRAYSDVKYVEPLIGPDTVNTMPLETLRAYHDHGAPALRLRGYREEADRTIAALAALSIDIEAVAAQLLEEGIEKFVQPYDTLLGAIEEVRARRGSPSALRNIVRE
jgi:transaldolase